MHIQSLGLFVLGLGCHFSGILAGKDGRGNKPSNGPPTICNTSPDDLIPARKFRNRGIAESPSSAVISAPSEDKLSKRAGTITYDASCGNAPPAGSKYGNGFPTMESILRQAYKDAVQLANKASVIEQSSTAYTNYFDVISREQSSHFDRMVTQIANSVVYFNAKFECSGTGGDCATHDNIVAAADATVGDNKVINICTRFWTTAQTRFFLYDASKGAKPGVPYRDNTTTGWCNNRLQSDHYATAGHTILHELTHLDALAAAAGLSAPTEGDDAGRHGTGDLQDGCALSGAREYKEAWDEDSTDELGSPDYNAESYAAAATENYFLRLCNFQSIPK